ncbi:MULTISPECIES: hypothetical protein [Microtetraspora]|uniref:Uncharacterized protein n=1 Tax=Microtetraspora fusca TaxID=1997 RepID=A0ABW6VKT5_MICFU|nr:MULTISPECIES: hypothetical protein [Microtetraspora]
MSRPPQAPPVRRPELIDPYTTLGLNAATREQRTRIRNLLTFNANVNDPAAFSRPSYEQAKLSAL